MAITSVSQLIFVYKATCLRVIDGDTIEADLDMGFKQRWTTSIRFHGIDTYEMRGSQAHPLGTTAKTFLEKLFRDYGPSFYIHTNRDEIAIYNRVAGRLFLETVIDEQRTFIDVIETMRANGFDKSGTVPHDPTQEAKLVSIPANDIMDIFRAK